MSVHPVIMCGGAGTRLWPASRPSTPKQFLALAGDRSMFQDTASRVMGVEDFAGLIVVGGARHERTIVEQLAAMGVSAGLLLEPEGRDSAPAMAAAAVFLAERDPDAVMVVVAADHHIPDAAGFRRALDAAVATARQGWITTLGVRPTAPSTAYGYIKPGEALSAGPARRVAAFVEKPDRKTAKAYVAARYLWNSGNFVVKAAVLVEELAAHAPDVLDSVRRALAEASVGDAFRLGAAFRTAPKISIDYAVMEKTSRAAVLPAAFAWSDLGAWDAVKAASPPDAAGNAVHGEAVLLDTSNALVRAGEGMLVALAGVRDIAVVAERDAVLVTALDRSQDVKRIVEQLARDGRPQVDRPAEPELSLRDHAARYAHWLTTAALPLWWALGADHVGGGFHEALASNAQPHPSPRRARVQARQIFTYATAGELGWPGPWRDAAGHGLTCLLRRYRRPDGLFRSAVTADGAPAEEAAGLYDQAFVLLALATVFNGDPKRTELADEAEALRQAIEAAFAHPAGGFREAVGAPFWANPHMHLLEAALAWAEAGGGAAWDDLAGRIVALALARFVDVGGGFLREYFDADWRPAEGAAGRVVEPGHQFEWAWLLDRWAERSGDAAAHAAARALYRTGGRGVDRLREVAVDELDDAGAVTRASARLWPQTERIKAALRLADGAPQAERTTCLADAASACRGLWRYLETPTRGLWRDRQQPDGSFLDEPAPASSFYHLIGAVAELRRRAPTA
jgi:mannose-1-phosphate guanylyltransferase/mannose-6-phosphate isomerase